MPSSDLLARRVPYKGTVPTAASLAEEQRQNRERQTERLNRVNKMVREHKDVAGGLRSKLGEMKDAGDRLDGTEVAGDEGIWAVVTRPFTRRRAALERKSAAHELLNRYDHVHVELRRAGRFADELDLCAAELHQELDGLHTRVDDALTNEKLSAQRVLELEEEADRHDPSTSAGERLRDQLDYALREEAGRLAVFTAQARLLKEQIEPARSLRDTVQRLHADLNRYLVEAAALVDGSGRKVQALGLAADAPLVVAELHASLQELGTAMLVTEQYVTQTHRLLTQVLPDVQAQIEASSSIEQVALGDELTLLSRQRARALADKALQEAAKAEVDALTGPEY